MLQALDEAAVRRWAYACCDTLATHRAEIDELNVFPVPDSDTGTNLLATMRAGYDAVRRHAEGSGTAEVLAVLARGALVGARGNSGVILSQLLRGMAESVADLSGAGGATGPGLRLALRRADELATAAVSDPMPGTVLSVLHAAADAAGSSSSDELADVVAATTDAATRALADTPHQLAVLARAGVVDAGGRGLVVLLETLHAVVTGRAVDPVPVPGPVPARSAPLLQAVRESGSSEYEYEVMYLLDSTDEDRVARLRAELAGLGDCVAVVGSGSGVEQVFSVHVHCTDIGAAVEAGVRGGRPHRITVIRFADQAAEAGEDARLFVTDASVLAMVGGDGIVELFRGEGALTAPGTCTVAELLAVLAGSRARRVTLLPGATAAHPVAETAAAQAREAGQDVIVVPTRSPVQALAALAVHDPARRPGDDVVAMAEAAAATRRGELTVAAAEALTWVGRCQAGDILGLIDDEVVLIDTDSGAAARMLIDRMLSSGGELVTVLLGRDAPDGVGDELARHLHAVHPEVELAVYPGGQPQSLLLMGVE